MNRIGPRWAKRIRRASGLSLVMGVALVSGFYYPVPAPPLVFPDGKKFAFTIVDDTDMATLERLRPLYEILDRYGLRTTKTVWVRESNNESHPPNQGVSLRDPAYREFILDLNRRGFEIALHGVRGGDSLRRETLDGLDEFKSILGQYPGMQVNHSINRENLYWGPHLYSSAFFRTALSFAIRQPFEGDDPGSPYFWGDVAKQHVKFVRRFTFEDVNLYAINPSMPYHLEDKPFVNLWFPTADGSRIVDFDELLKTENLDRLERENGVCIVYSHLGSGSFNRKDGPTPDPRFEERIKAIAARAGWFVPASTILEFLKQQPAWTGTMGWRESTRLDLKFIASHIGL